MDDDTKAELAKARQRISELENNVNRLFGGVLAVAACLCASNSLDQVSDDDAKAQLSGLADPPPVPEDLAKIAGRTIGVILRQAAK